MKIETIQSKATYHILKTAHEGFVTGYCLVPAGLIYTDFENRYVPGLMASMLSLGTQKKTEEEWNEVLESKGISLGVSVKEASLMVHFTCLTKHVSFVLALVAEALQEPLFDKKAFEMLKQRRLTQYQSSEDDTAYRASATYSQLLYPKEHLGRTDDPKESIEILEKITVDDLRAYHQSINIMAATQWVFVGDVDASIQAECDKYVSEGKACDVKRSPITGVKIMPEKKTVVIKDKQSVDVRMGHVLPMDHQHPDFIPLLLAVDALGGSFSARLMRTVRDEDGLTYNVGSRLVKTTSGNQCHWVLSASFSPKLLEKGLASIQKQLKLWIEKGLTQEELDERKQGMLGKHQVTLSDAQVVASKLALSLELGYGISHLEDFPKEVEGTTLEQVNKALQTYIQLDQVTEVCAGTL